MKILQTLADAFKTLNDPVKAMTTYQELYAHALSSGDYYYQSKALVSLADLYYKGDLMTQTIVHYERLLGIISEFFGPEEGGTLPDFWSVQLECDVRYRLCRAYKSTGNILAALEQAMVYLGLIQKHETPMETLAETFHNLGEVLQIVYSQKMARKKNRMIDMFFFKCLCGNNCLIL